MEFRTILTSISWWVIIQMILRHKIWKSHHGHSWCAYFALKYRFGLILKPCLQFRVATLSMDAWSQNKITSLNAFLEPIVCSGISLTLDRSNDIFLFWFSCFSSAHKYLYFLENSKNSKSVFIFTLIFLVLNFAINLALSLILILNVGWMAANGWARAPKMIVTWSSTKISDEWA